MIHETITVIVSILGGMAVLYGFGLAIIKKKKNDKKGLSELQDEFAVFEKKLTALEEKVSQSDTIYKKDIQQLETDWRFLINKILDRIKI